MQRLWVRRYSCGGRPDLGVRRVGPAAPVKKPFHDPVVFGHQASLPAPPCPARSIWLGAEQSRERPLVLVWAGIEGAQLPPADGRQAQPPQPFLPGVRADVEVAV
jgi:hypothetical protein